MKTKFAYITPQVKVTTIELEQGIAVGSASVKPENPNNNQVLEEWEVGNDDFREIEW